ncbi:hypothetical protein SUGI_1064380 [Cryptomeria japonica]|uniref:FCS-Like Zinc finger 3 n=1 Tax=Cryptomeria japonica TaxID=3369 RepID=UPI002414ABA2|nr:FCS-Like Zinc finger 3 [Cryptomeria japonica]GLJ50043.1 hypothetical protein SUGI_1064380 [Cryptomeria japonica]
MHLGKRPRPPPGSPMRRTTSMSLLTEREVQVHEEPSNGVAAQRPVNGVCVFRPSISMAPFAHFFVPQPDYFLQSCSLCKRHLNPGRDIYMYKGDAAFCSTECRDEQIIKDERMEKCGVVVRKKESGSTNHRRHQATAGANQNTLAAA